MKRFSIPRPLAIVVALTIVGPHAACSKEPATTEETSMQPASKKETAQASQVVMDVYKSPTCGCCTKWVDHMSAAGIQSNLHHPEDLDAVKAKFGIPRSHQSCHTAVTADGFVFEGHVPAKFVQRFLAEKPEGAIGLAVPEMPIGSPGMESGDAFSPYQVFVLKADGSSDVYASVNSAADQQ